MAGDKMETDTPENAAVVKQEDKPKAEPKLTPQQSLQNIASLLENAVKLKETRLLTGRVMRLTAAIRNKLTPEILTAFISTSVDESCTLKSNLIAVLKQVPATPSTDTDSAMQTDDASTAKTEDAPKPPTPSSTPELEMYAALLVVMYLLDKKQYALAKDLTTGCVERLHTFNRRTMDVIAARVYSYYQLAYEKLGQMADVRSTLLALHRTAHLRHDVVGQETLLNLLLRNYLSFNLYDQAEKFRSKAQRSDLFRSHAQYVRYLYYLGKIRAVQLEYSEARDCLQQASRKAPSSCLGFRISADKWLILVRLLLGEVPDRTEFVAPGLAKPLRPYFELTQAVRSGDTVAFAQVSQRHAAVFRADGVQHLVSRLHHNVLRTGLRRISLAYSRISLADVAVRLHVPNAEDAECIVAKAIRDGAIDAVIDHQSQTMMSRETQDVYLSSAPAESFHERTAFCLDLHNEAIKALRYEPDHHRRKLVTVEDQADRLAVEAEIAAMEDEDDF